MLKGRISITEGGVATLTRAAFQLQCVHIIYPDAMIIAKSESFESLIDLRYQLVELGYKMVSLNGDL